ncbi:MAG: hypothetical protein SWK76_11040 [Actinomycetota bacterium]|nr:hypothetical protein [Actinomycetota bacterium]
MDALLKRLEQDCEVSLLQEKVIASRPAQSKVIIAGGVVFKGLTCLVGERNEAGEVMNALEQRLDGFEVVRAPGMKVADSITPLDIYRFTYEKKVIGVSRVVFFEYATQMALVGIYRDRDRNLVNELFGHLAKLKEYMTIPNPLRTDEKDGRVEVNMFMIRHPLKEELQSDFVNAIIKTSGLSFYVS